MSARARILERIREVLETRERTEHPGGFEGTRPDRPTATTGDPAHASPAASIDTSGPDSIGASTVGPTGSSTLGAFETAFEAAGGDSVRLENLDAVGEWLGETVPAHGSIVVGEGVPAEVVPERERRSAEDADVGLSLAVGAAAETGTIVLDARDGRRAQLLAPTHVILVPAGAVQHTLVEVLATIRGDLPSAFGLHSGPSKSADIGQVMVRGVHGPGRVTAVIYGAEP